MKVIALLSKANTGKSHTINLVYSFLLRDGYTQIPGFFKILGNPKFEDVFDILEKEDMKIGFVGMGDYQRGENRLSNFIKDLEKQGCNFVICACREEKGIIKEVEKFNHIFIHKTISKGIEENRIVNVKDANSMISEIKKLTSL